MRFSFACSTTELNIKDIVFLLKKVNVFLNRLRSIKHALGAKIRAILLLDHPPRQNIRWITRETRSISSKDYVKRFGGTWYAVIPQGDTIVPSEANYGNIRASTGNQPFPCRELGVVALANGIVYGKESWILGRNSLHLSDLANDERIAAGRKRYIPRVMPRARYLKGKALSIASDYCFHYGHWLVESLPRLELFKRAGFNIDELDYILCNKVLPGTPNNLFNTLGLPSEKLIWIDSQSIYRVETLFATSFPNPWNQVHHWIPEFLQRKFLPVSLKQPWRRLYLTRKGYSRNPINEDEVNKVLLDFGFEFFNPEDSQESHVIFSQASMVVGCVGSAMAGLMFCSPGAKVLEFIPTDMLGSSKYMANSSRLVYGCIICRSMNLEEGELNQDPLSQSSYSDFYVDVKLLRNALSAMINC